MIAETILWRGIREDTSVRCAIVHGCGGVDLQIVQDERVTRTERHGMRDTACERARALRVDFERAGYTIVDGSPA